MGRIRQRLLWVAMAMAGTLAIGTVGFVAIDSYPWFEAFYMTLITVLTVGYGEILPLSFWGRVFNSGLLLVGVTVILLATGAMTQTVLELELNQFFGKRRNKNMIDKLKGHYILCGYGRVGRGAAAELTAAGAPFVVIDSSEDRVERAMQAGLLAVVADATRDDALREVGIARAKGLIATLGTDADNLFLTMTAKTLNPLLQLSARVAEDTSEPKMRRAGATFVFAPYISTGHRMAQALLKPHVLQFLDYTMQEGTRAEAGIEQIRIEPGSAFCKRTIREVALNKGKEVVVLALRRSSGKMIYNPDDTERLAGGDYLIVMGEPSGLDQLEKILAETAEEGA
ncbi:MAG: potassium channel protein [Acidobacteriota bacterium]